MSPSKNVSRFVAIALAALTIPALSLSVSPMAAAVTTCPDGWVEVNSIAIDGIFCDRLATADGSFTVPDGIDEIHILAVAGGGGGGAGGKTTVLVAGGGGGAGGINGDFVSVVSGDTVNYTVGQGGTAGAFTVLGGATSGGNGTDSTVSIGAGAAIVVAQGGGGGVAGEDGGTGGASGAYYGTSNAGGAGSSSNPAAGGGGGGWLTAGVAGTEGAIEKGGNGGTGFGVQEYPFIDHPTHNAFPNETLNWNTNGNPDPMFLDRMGHGGGGGVVLDVGMDCSGESTQYLGYSIPNENLPISQLGSGSCAIQGVEDYAGATAVTATYAGTGGSGAAGTATDSYSQPTAGYDGFVYFRIFVQGEAGPVDPNYATINDVDWNIYSNSLEEMDDTYYDAYGLDGSVFSISLHGANDLDSFICAGDDVGTLEGDGDYLVNCEEFQDSHVEGIQWTGNVKVFDGDYLGLVARQVVSLKNTTGADIVIDYEYDINTEECNISDGGAGTTGTPDGDLIVESGETWWAGSNDDDALEGIAFGTDGYARGDGNDNAADEGFGILADDTIIDAEGINHFYAWNDAGVTVPAGTTINFVYFYSSIGAGDHGSDADGAMTDAEFNAQTAALFGTPATLLANTRLMEGIAGGAYNWESRPAALASTGVTGDALTAGLAGGIAALLGGVLLVATRRRHALIES